MSSFTNITASARKTFGGLAVSGLVTLAIYLYVTNHPCCISATKLLLHKLDRSINFDSSTNLSHIVFGIAGSTTTWSNRKWYTESWWRPNKTRGFLFMDKTPLEHLPWPSSSPPLKILQYEEYHKQLAIRVLLVIQEICKVDQSKGETRWYVLVDDDTILLVDNLVEVLSKYDHRKYFYIGMSSESVVPNWINSFEMAFAGAGFALSFPLAKALAKNMDSCIKRYQTVLGSDHILQSCISDLGVPLTKERGFHQIDFHGDISGFLSAHPQTPFISLHHLDFIDPIFPSMNREDSMRHLMKAAKVDESRLLQQSICYYNIMNWSFSVSWGYSVQIYEEFIPPSILQRPLATFTEWLKGAHPPFMFNFRPHQPHKNPCEAPHVFFFNEVEERPRANHTITSYRKGFSASMPKSSSSCINSSAQHISKIHVHSPMNRLHSGGGSRRECCDVVQFVGMDSIGIKLRACMKNEIVG